MGIFGDMFDFNGDGELDAMEKAAEFGAFMSMMESFREDELKSAELDPYEFDQMDDLQRREALEDAGLDPDDYDF